ncbi:MAG: polysaccharide biosynthesis tyrosine autokinase [Marinilabiliaceae bacterium]|nr:polysaccharide biosynthesis tyrosine autokinase [Marinilabiliaceae bacterium]
MRSIEDAEMDKNIDLIKIFFRLLSYWYIFPICIAIFASYSIYTYKKTTPLYKVGTKLMIGSNQSLSEGIGGMGGALPTVMLNQIQQENQHIILTSRHQIEKILRQLDFEISYFKQDKYREIEIYKDSPFRVIVDTTEIKPINLKFDLKFLSQDKFLLTSKDLDFEQEVNFFEKINHPRFSYSIVPVEENTINSNYVGGHYRFQINTMNRLISQYQNKVKIETVRGGSSIVELSVVESNTQKGIDFLNKLAQASVNYTLDKKNHIATNTILFIEKQLMEVSDSLSEAENALEEFRVRHQIMDVSLQSQQIMSRSAELEMERSALSRTLDYFNYLQSYLENNRNILEIVPPIAYGITDPTLGNFTNQLIELNSKRAALLFTSTKENPAVKNLDRQIEAVKISTIDAIKNFRSQTERSRNNLNRQLYGVRQDISNVPKLEQTFAGMQKTFRIQDELSTFLMQKLTEAQMAKASNLPDNEIIEDASYRYQVAPDSKKNIMIVFMGGLALPAVIIFLVIFLNDRVLDIEDIKNITSASVIGQVPIEKVKGAKKKRKAVISTDKPNTILAESFRSIRVSMSFYANQKEKKTILFTSTLPGEGKSFCAINLAHSFAQLGKRTLLVEFDLRRPSVSRQTGLKPPEMGLSNFYTGEKDINNILLRDTGVPNFNIIFSGQIPPNPAELIASEETNQLMEALQSYYDVVILDTPPLGLVSDAHLLAAYADINILVVRHNSTPKPVLKINLRDEKTKKMPNLTVLLNGIPFQKKEYSYQYGYSMRNKYITRKA